jgi:hypothetical protein
MAGLQHALEIPTIRKRLLTKLVRTSAARIASTPAGAIAHCHLCGAAHHMQASHLCPRLYGR